MAHRSDAATRLEIDHQPAKGLRELPPADKRPAVWLFVTRAERGVPEAERAGWHAEFREWCNALHEQSVVCVYTSSAEAAVLWPRVEGSLRFQLWIAVKTVLPRSTVSKQALPHHHAALLVLSRYRKPLRHATTRIGYTYCPACDRTTKDYGGKKHLYHPYGTLMSDVWRDIACVPGEMPEPVIDRLSDLFGISPYQHLHVIDLRSIEERARARKRVTATTRVEHSPPSTLESALVNDDCLCALAKLPSDSVDFCFADPPYNLDKRYDAWDDAIDVARYFEWCDRWLSELSRVLKPGRTLAVLNIPQWTIRHFKHLCSILHFQNWICWEGLSLPVRMIMPAHYAIACFSKGAAAPLPTVKRLEPSPLERRALTSDREFFCRRAACLVRQHATDGDASPITDLWWDIHRLKHNSRRVEHPCQLPPALMHRLIALFSHEDEVVLDPFDGSGTTTLCARQLGRRYIGVELSRAYHELAVHRHAALALGTDPFEKTYATPMAKNSRVRRLRKQRYEVDKKTLQLEVRRIAQTLGRRPTRQDVQRHGRFPLRYFDDYFINWGEVTAAVRHGGMNEHRASSRQAEA